LKKESARQSNATADQKWLRNVLPTLPIVPKICLRHKWCQKYGLRQFTFTHKAALARQSGHSTGDNRRPACSPGFDRRH
jgi:hypothetical protein